MTMRNKKDLINMKYKIGTTVKIISDTINGQMVPGSFKIGKVIQYNINSKLYYVSNGKNQGFVVCDENELTKHDKLAKIICNPNTANILFNNPDFEIMIDDSFLDWQVHAQFIPEMKDINYTVNIIGRKESNNEK